MNVAIVAEDYSIRRGGIEYHAFHLAKCLRERNHIVDLITPTSLTDVNRRRYDWVLAEGVYRPVLARLHFQSGFRRARKALFTHGSYYEFIHRSELGPRGHPRSLPVQMAKLVADLLYFRRQIANLDLVFALSAPERSDLLKIGFPPDRVVVLPNFVEPPTLGQLGHSQNYSQERPYVCAIGRVDGRKNFGAVLDALQGLRLGFLVAGRDAGGVAALLAHQAAVELPGFRYLGPVSEAEKYALIRGSVGLVLPSRFEGVPITALEALALEIPVVCTRRSYMDKQDGLTLCDTDVASLRSAIERMHLSPPGHFEHIPTGREIAERLERLLERNTLGACSPTRS